MIKRYNEQVYSILCAAFLSVQAINHIIVAYFPFTKGNAMMLLYLMTGGLIIADGFVEIIKSRKVYISNAAAVFLIMAYYSVTLIIAPYSDLEASQFFSMTIVAMIAPTIRKIDPKVFINALLLIPVPGILVLNRIFVVRGIKASIIGMGLSYAFIPSIIAAIVFTFKYIKNCEHKVLYGVAILINAVYAWEVIQYGSRGPILCIISCFGLLIGFNIKKDGGVFLKPVKLLVILSILFAFMMNFYEILEWVFNRLTGFGIKVNSIAKIFRLQEGSGDISNGRILIWQTVIKEIMRTPIWGHGLSTTQYNLGIIYPHNFIK